MKRILTFLIALSVLLTISVAAYAHAIPEERNDCSIEVIVRYNGEDVSGGSLTAIRIGYVAEDDGNYFFRQVMTDEVVEDIGSPDLVAILETKLVDDALWGRIQQGWIALAYTE